MSSEVVIIVGVTFQNSAQMRLAQDNDVVHTFTPDRSDQPFGKSILPGRRRCNGPIPNTHGTQSTCDDAAIDPVAIADHVARRFIPRECLRDLARNPSCRRSCRNVDPDELSAVQPNDDEGIGTCSRSSKTLVRRGRSIWFGWSWPQALRSRHQRERAWI
jgi:hypothetical protein